MKDARLKKVDVRTDGGAGILTGAVPGIGVRARASGLAPGVPSVRMGKNAEPREDRAHRARRQGARAGVGRDALGTWDQRPLGGQDRGAQNEGDEVIGSDEEFLSLPPP